MASSSHTPEPIAIVGSACRFAGGADTPSKLWELLRDPQDVRSEIPRDRFNAKAFYHPDGTHHGHMNVLHSYLLEQNPRLFDAEFFGINPLEARAMDPQQRMLLEVVYEAIESAGLSLEGLRGSDTGVYAGLMCGDYEAMLLRDLDQAPTYFAVGTSRAVLSNRISYFFDWHGASITVDTACSSSLVAVHQAVQALRAGDSRMAIACGSNLILGPEMYIIESKLKMLSPDGLSRMWDKEANGYARGEGVACVALKTLRQALADGDHIHALLRETGVNQDGATAGLTMPSAQAQRELIHSVYRKAGLDPTDPTHRPQYIEAHGTGTPAGDPVEAEALSTAFFGMPAEAQAQVPLQAKLPVPDPIYTGSIKTVLGHTEGTAGIAALLKVVQAINHSTIPPNLLFNELSPAVAPFYGSVQIPTQALPWPLPPAGQPKRASVNNFGFGGTNAHAILESYQGPEPEGTLFAVGATPLTPYVFSAASDESLRANLAAYIEYLSRHPDTNAHALAYTLRQRRSRHAHRVAFPAVTLADLRKSIENRLLVTDSPVGTRTWRKPGASSKILAVFTGQGAQYARMGAELVEKSPFAEKTLQSLEGFLAELPAADRPSWSLYTELLADASVSRVGEAAISQPLCTAVQILLVDTLRSAGVQFAAVTGHSSGEIAAAYAAGHLTARDAILIAYYRGLYCKLAHSPNGNIQGAMMAVGTTLEDAIELCSSEEFTGRLSVAASNSASSVTVSGDEDAIEELAAILEDEKKFHRRLRVDQAYHSGHMVPCSSPYIASLQSASIKAQPESQAGCVWFSSVFGGRPIDCARDQVSDTYWAENMVKPVLFSQALEAAITDNAYDAVLEIGPHPALAGPAAQTIEAALGKKLPYHGVLDRKQDATTALSACLGFLWTQLDAAAVDLGRCEAALSPLGPESLCAQSKVLPDLPSYRWNHLVEYWAESRKSRSIRQRSEPYHQLLGTASPDSAPHALRWQNVLKPSEMPWVEGHQVQKQIVLPAAAYVATAVEAARAMAKNRSVRLVELDGFHIHNAIMFDQNDTGVEVHVELAPVSEAADGTITARFSYSAALGGSLSDLVLAADGQLKVVLGEPSLTLLPARSKPPPHIIPVEPSRLYGFMQSLEYDFSGPLRSLVQMERKLGKAVCIAQRASTTVADADAVMLHPVDLDAAFQSAILAYSYPGDDQLRRLHLPTTIGKVRVNPAVLTSEHYTRATTTALDSRCSAADRATPGSGFSGSVAMFAPGHAHAAVQVEQLQFRPVGSDASNDRDVFYKMHWLPSQPDGTLAASQIPISSHDRDVMFVLSRIAAFYLRRFDAMVPAEDPVRSTSPLCHYLNYARHMTELLRKGEHKWAHAEWLNDSEQDVLEDVAKHGYADNSDVRIMLLVGAVMPRVFRGETTMLEHFRTSGLLDEYYSNGFGTRQCTMWVAGVLRQITNCNPHLNILEIGAGTGGATKSILGTIGHDFETYTFTDISSSFFEKAAETLDEWRDQLVFKVCNAEVDPVSQGFEAGTYDVVVAFMVVHACARLDEAVANLRRLLKPGGLLVLGEGASDGAMQAGAGFIFGTLPGWWRGVDEGRTLSPLVSANEWDGLLRGAGFSGIDTMSPPTLFDAFGITLFVSTAVDERVSFLREPLAPASAPLLEKSPVANGIILIGGATAPVARLIDDVRAALAPVTRDVSVFPTLEALGNCAALGRGAVVVSFVDLEAPVFRDITAERWAAFRPLFQRDGHVVWLTRGRLTDEPYCNMTVGFARSAVHENDALRVQCIDIADVASLNGRTVAAAALRFVAPQLDPDAAPLLYTKEPEIILDAAGRELIPRLFTIQDANDRLNSVTRPISREVDMSRAVVELVRDASGTSSLRTLSRYQTSEVLVPQPRRAGETIDLRLTHAVASALRTPAGYQFLALGVDAAGSQYLTLASSLTSTLKAPVKLALRLETATAAVSHLLLVAAGLVAMAIVDPLFAGQKLLVHNAPDAVVQATRRHAAAKNIAATFTTDTACTSADFVPCTKLDPYMSRSDLAEILPSDVVCFVGFSGDNSELEKAVISCLPSHCRKESGQTLYAPSGDEAGAAQTLLEEMLQRATAGAQPQGLEPSATTTSLESLSRGEAPHEPLTIVDWTADSIPARVSRIEATQLFKADKTYWLVGLSGALGISLCDWMIDRGVRYLVLTSRNPKIDPRWIESHERCGVTIKIILCDVTDEAAIRSVHQTIVETLPPIIGLLNGAMVLRDVSVANMEFEQVTDVIRPKVLGSLHLDRIFQDVDLDFFVLLSSINCVIGNVGQANYAAANMGMIGVAGQRRKRGLRSSVVNVGAIIGVGYITQSARQLDVTVAKTAMMHLSEQDFHQIFAEAMEAGHLDSPDGPEISTGLLRVPPDCINIPPWYSDPKFAHFRVRRPAATGGDGNGAETEAASTQDQLQACRTRAEAALVVKRAFAAQLRRTLQVAMPDDDLMQMRGAELGFDSLISVDIRSWFLKTFQVSIPVLKIMANDVQMAGLVEEAAEGLPDTLVPRLAQGSPNSGSSSDACSDSQDNSPKDSSRATSPLVTPGDGSPLFKPIDSAVIDWAAEAVPPESEDTADYAGTAPPRPVPEVVVLTGCSGLLGHHLLAHLLAEGTIRKVVCVAVRQLSERLASGALPAPSERLVYHEGDLTSPRFGLTRDAWVSLFREADAIVHNGSDTSHLKYYTAVRQANVVSTRQIAAACVPRRVPLHYVSSAGVALFAGRDAFPEVSCTTTGTLPPRDGSHGYMCGKWVCESFLERLHAATGLPVVIQRPSTIIRAGDDAAATRAEFDWVNALLHYAHKTRCVPRVAHCAGAFDLVDVQTCCRDVVRELLRPAASSPRPITYVNNVGDQTIPMDRMADLGLAHGGTPYEVQEMECWVQTVIAAGMHPAVAALIETFDEPGVAKYPALLRERRE